jgi:DNA-binding NtrC family response regulator
MSPPANKDAIGPILGDDLDSAVPNVVVVDPRFDAYKPLAASARLGKLNLHLRASGSEALKFARRRRVDVWLVGTELEDMSGNDFLELLQSRVGGSKVAVVGATGGSRDAADPSADTVLSTPITFRDLEVLLGLAPGDRPVLPESANRASRAFVTLPIGVGAAVVAIAVLMLS